MLCLCQSCSNKFNCHTFKRLPQDFRTQSIDQFLVKSNRNGFCLNPLKSHCSFLKGHKYSLFCWHIYGSSDLRPHQNCPLSSHVLPCSCKAFQAPPLIQFQRLKNHMDRWSHGLTGASVFLFPSNIFLLIIWKCCTMYPDHTRFPFLLGPPSYACAYTPPKCNFCCPYTHWSMVKLPVVSLLKITELCATLHPLNNFEELHASIFITIFKDFPQWPSCLDCFFFSLGRLLKEPSMSLIFNDKSGVT